MPARQYRPLPPPKADPLADLEQLVAALGDDAVRALAEAWEPEDVALVERIIAERHASGWRASPASMAEHLTADDPEPYRRWRHIDLMADAIAATIRGESGNRLAINTPSQVGKTLLLVWSIIWILDRNPRARIMFVSYDANKAVEEGQIARDLAIRFAPHLRFTLRPDAKARGRWRTDQGGGLYCVGINGAITGFPADVVLVDDLLKNWVEALSPAIRNKAWSVLQSSVRMRLQGPASVMIWTGTRWNEDDHFARVFAQAEADPRADQWQHIRLAAIAEPPDPDARDPLMRAPDPLGRAPGEVLVPERFPPEEVLARKIALGSQQWTAVEQQRPTAPEGNIIKRAWWRRGPIQPVAFDEVIGSWDTKLKDVSDQGDWTVGQVWGRTGGHFWGLAQYRGQWDMAQAKVAVALSIVRFPQISATVFERAGYAPELKKALEAAQPGWTLDPDLAGQMGVTLAEVPGVETVVRRGISAITLWPVEGSKTARALLQAPKLEAGNVHLPPDGTAWADDLVEEAAAFPDGAHDDMVDAWSQAMSRLSRVGDVAVVRPGARRSRSMSGPIG